MLINVKYSIYKTLIIKYYCFKEFNKNMFIYEKDNAININFDGNTVETTPDVVIKINPERSDLVETKVIDGRKYLLIEVGSNIQVNGVALSATESAE